MSCSAFVPSSQHQQGQEVPEQRPYLKQQTALVSDASVKSLPRRAVNEPPPSKGLLHSKFILHGEEERIRH